MSNLMQKYSIFSQMLIEDNIYLYPNVSFNTLASLIGFDVITMNKLLYKELGFTGEDIINNMKQLYLQNVKNKYNINI